MIALGGSNFDSLDDAHWHSPNSVDKYYCQNLNGTITKHIVEYAGSTFDYNQIDSLITTVTRDGEFTTEFTKEINDYLGAEQNITYAAAVAIIGAASIDGTILLVAGADGNFVG